MKNVQAFVRFCNFYHRFILNFSKIAGLLNSLIKKDTAFVWSIDYRRAFQELKRHACKASILKYFNLSKQCFVKIDSSDYVNAGVLFQRGKNSLLHPVAYFSRRIAQAKCNYEIYNKELLVIICCFEEWQLELERTKISVQMLTDHKRLEYFMTTKKLTSRQAMWAKFLSEFNFIISYQNGKKMTRPMHSCAS